MRRKSQVRDTVLVLLIVVTAMEAHPAVSGDDAKGVEDSCKRIRLSVSIGRVRYSAGQSLSARVEVQNSSDHTITLRRDKVASTLTYERFQNGHWRTIGGTGLGRGVGSNGSKPTELSKREAVKAALEDYVLLHPRESFAIIADVDPWLLLEKGQPKESLKGRYRLTFVYDDDLPNFIPEYPSTCKFTSNRVTFDIK